jgi:hypothetical protein
MGALVLTVAVIGFLASGGGSWATGGPARPAPPAAHGLAGLASARSRTAPDAGRAQAEHAGLDVDDVIDKVRHRVTPAPAGGDTLVAQDGRYRATFDGRGYHIALGPKDRNAELGVSVTGARRGGRVLPLALASWKGRHNVATRQLRPGLEERVTARGGELEWDVVLETSPPGTGDLQVEAELRGLRGAPERLQAADSSAWRLPLGAGRSARLGEVIVRDAHGAARWRALPQIEGSHLRVEVPASVLAHADYPLTVDPVVSPEHPVSSASSYGNAAGAQVLPAVAFDGTNFLVVWADSRSGDGFDIYGARVSRAGAVLDVAGIPISTAPKEQVLPSVAFDGTNFLVVWADTRSGVSSDIYGARVSRAGAVLDAAGIPISTAAGDQQSPAVAFDGSNFLVVWQDTRSGSYSSDVYGARVSRAGAVLDAAGIPISTAGDEQAGPGVAFDGTNFLVVWSDASNSDISGTRVSRAGAVLDAAGIPISNSPPGLDGPPAVAFDGTNFLVAYQTRAQFGETVNAIRVSPAGAVLGGFIGVSCCAAEFGRAAVAFDGTNFLVVWADLRSGTTDIFGARVSPAGTVLNTGGSLISTAAPDQSKPAVAFDGTNFLVVWQEVRGGGNSDIFAARVSPAGAVLGGIAIATATTQESSPAVAFDGTGFLVVWQDSGIFGAKVSPAGAVSSRIAISTGGVALFMSRPAVAFDGTNYLVAWAAVGFGGSGIQGARLSRAGTVLTTGIAIAGTASSLDSPPPAPAVAFDGTNYLVVWQDPGSGTTTDIYGARVSRAGAVLDAARIAISTAANGQSSPAVALVGTNFLVVWQDLRSGSSDIYGARVSGAGVVLDVNGIPISTAPDSQDTPAVAVNGSALVVWRDRRSGVGFDIYGARVGSNGVVTDGSGIPIANAPGDEASPAVAGGPGDDWGVVNARFVGPPFGAHRVFLRTVSPK